MDCRVKTQGAVLWWFTSLRCAISALADSMSPLADHVMDLQNIVVILFCLRCGSEDIFENGSGWIWVKGMACFPRFVLRGPARAPISLMWSRSDLMTITVALLWFCSPFQRAASNSLSCTENVPHHVFITTVIFPTNHKVSSLRRTTCRTSWLTHKSSVCPSAFLFRFCLSPSLSLCPIRSIFRG